MGSHKIPCNAIAVSSQKNFWHTASRGRLNLRPYHTMPSGWSAAKYDVKPWLQIYLRYPKVITGIATQGGRTKRARNWVTSYKISYSMDGKTWTFYKAAVVTKVSFDEVNFVNSFHVLSGNSLFHGYGK
jgi:hypothetical protein